MNPWWELARNEWSIEVLHPGQVLQRLVKRDQPATILPSLDDPEDFRQRSLTLLREAGRRWSGSSTADRSDGLLLLDRSIGDPFYDTRDSETPSSGAARRSIPNMSAISEALGVPYGDLGSWSPERQIQVCSTTSILVGQHGAGLAGMVWMNPGGVVIEIQPPVGAIEQTMFSKLAVACGHDYLRVPQQSNHAPVDPNSVTGALAKFGWE